MEAGFLFVSIVWKDIKKKYKNSYQYGGTWKSRKKIVIFKKTKKYFFNILN